MNARKFLAGMEPDHRLGIFVEYEVAGVRWYGSEMDTHDSLCHHPAENVILHLFRKDDGGFSWDYSLKIDEGVYVHHSDVATTLDEAGLAALAYQPTEYVFDWLEETTWYETKPGHLTAVLAGDEASINKIDWAPYDKEPRYNWSRKWAPAAGVLAAINQYDHDLCGTADTLEHALLAVMEAPGRLTMACAALVATLRQQERSHA